MTSDDEAPDPLLGATIEDKYRVDRLIGSGGMGSVYQATNLSFGKRVAMKFLEPAAARDKDTVARFQREAESASAVESAHIVQIFDSGIGPEGRPYLVMELLSGEDLRARLRREERLDVAEAAHVVAQVLRALARAHDAGIIHRDLKPDNVFLCERDDEAMFVKIVDFGISKIARRAATADTLTRRGTVLGTAFYMAPEQAQGFPDIDGRADLWSVGSILYESLSGRPPHVATTYEAVLIKNCTEDAADVRTHAPDVPEDLAFVVQKALARERTERYQTAKEFYEALAGALPELMSTGPPIPSTRRRSPRDSTPSEPGFRTAEGTSVHTHTEGKTNTRRAIVAAFIAALGAFAITAFVMQRPVDAPASPVPEETRSASAIQPADEHVTQPATAATSDAPKVAIAADPPTKDGGTAAERATKPTKITTPRPAVGAQPAGKTAPRPKPAPGVAEGLELDTSGP